MEEESRARSRLWSKESSSSVTEDEGSSHAEPPAEITGWGWLVTETHFPEMYLPDRTPAPDRCELSLLPHPPAHHDGLLPFMRQTSAACDLGRGEGGGE